VEEAVVQFKTTNMVIGASLGTFNRISGASAGALRRSPHPHTAALRCVLVFKSIYLLERKAALSQDRLLAPSP
jgi:hypothetical protein